MLPGGFLGSIILALFNNFLFISGVQLYELHLPIFMAAQLDQNENPGDTHEKMNEAFKFLEETIDHLQYEQEGTFENSLYQGTLVGLLKGGFPIPRSLFTKIQALKACIMG